MNQPKVIRIKESDFRTFLADYRDDFLKYFDVENIDDTNENLAYWAVVIDDVIVSVCSMIYYTTGTDFQNYGVKIGDGYTPPQYRGNGYSTLLIQKGIAIAKEMQCCIYAVALIDTSYKIFKKLGFSEEGLSRIPVVLRFQDGDK